MARNAYGNDTYSPYSWQSGDTTTFANQSENLAKQAGDAGLDTTGIQIQNETAKAQQQAGQSGQNAAAGADTISQGGQYNPTMAQTGDTSQKQPNGPTIQPLPVKPSTDVKANTDFSKESNFEDPTIKYLESLFPNGLPPSVQSKIGSNMSYYNEKIPFIGGTIEPKYDPNALSGSYNQLIDEINRYNQQNVNNPSSTVTQGYEDFLQNELANKSNVLDTDYNKYQNDLANQLSERNKQISDYISGLNENLKKYKDKTGDISNIGEMSDAEKQAAATNELLANSKDNAQALSALTGQNFDKDTRLAALSQQAESAAINKARGEATAALNNSKTGREILEAGQKAQQDAYKKAGENITKNQSDSLKKLDQNATDAQRQLADAYNNAKTNLSKQEQDYVNRAQDTLKNAKVSPNILTNATQAFTNSVTKYLDNHQLDDKQKSMLRSQLESIYRTAIGANPNADINYSDKIAGYLIPIFAKLGGETNHHFSG